MNYNKSVRRCSCCVMPEQKNIIELDKNGICNICNRFIETNITTGESFDNLSDEQRLNILKKKVARLKTNSIYDCAVSVSGGKDSIMTLYIAKKVLNLNPLAIFLDNGYALDEMYDNVKNATDILGVDLTIFKTSALQEIFKDMILSKKKLYYCRVCHTLIDYHIRDICSKYNIKLVLGGYTKGQQYIKNSELFDIYKISDKNIVEIIENNPKFSYLVDLFKNQSDYFKNNFGTIVQLSPFKYIRWNEDEILDVITKELKFKLPKRSWPDKSSNCQFNYVSQYLAMKQFGFAQHEVELSELVRSKELTRNRALEIIETPIEDTDLVFALNRTNLTLKDIID